MIVYQVEAVHADGATTELSGRAVLVLATDILVPRHLSLSLTRAGRDSGTDETALAPGRTLLLCVEREHDGDWIVPAGSYSSMPANNALVHVLGPDDPQVGQVLRQVRQLRSEAMSAAARSLQWPTPANAPR